MTPTIPIRKALADPALLGKTLTGVSWLAWRVILIAAMGEPLTDAERIVFKQLTNREREPLERVDELVAVVGRRGGKSRAAATLIVYIAALCRHRLVKGETGVALLIAPDMRQAAIALSYAAAILDQSPILKQLVASVTADTIALSSGINIEVRAASFRRLRGPTYIACVCDESAFWYSDELSANADTEILNAVRPGLSTTQGPLVIISSPHARRGVVWDAYKGHFGPEGDPEILVAQAASRTMNPSLPQSVVDRALERDRAHASAEFLATFRTDIESFIALEVVESCLGDYVERAPLPRQRYSAFVDPSGGSSDSFTLAVSHAEGERVIIDATREVKPKFSPEAVVDDFATLLKTYRIRTVRGDRYAGEWPREQFRKRGITYRVSDKSKSDLYRDALPLMNSGRITLPKSDRLVSQLVGLERRVSRAGRDSIDHAPGSHDDLANAVCGATDAADPGKKYHPPVARFGVYGDFTREEVARRGLRLFDFDPDGDDVREPTLLERSKTWSAPCVLEFSPEPSPSDGFTTRTQWEP
jgi:hypothetical protein